MKVNLYLKPNFWKTFREHHHTFQNPGWWCWKVSPLSLLQTTDKIWISMLIIGYNSLMKPCIREKFLMIYLSYVVREKIFFLFSGIACASLRNWFFFVLWVEEHIKRFRGSLSTASHFWNCLALPSICQHCKVWINKNEKL